MRTFEFSTPELAVLVQHMTGGVLQLDAAAVADLDSSEDGLASAEEQLRDRGLLVSAPLEEEAAVSSQLAPVLRCALDPDVLGIMRVERRTATGTTPDVSYYSFTDECMVHNRVDARGNHVFTEFGSIDEVLSALTATAAHAGSSGASAEPLESLLPVSDSVNLLLMVAGTGGPDAATQATSWVIARDAVWLVDRRDNDGLPMAIATTGDDLRAALLDALQGETQLVFGQRNGTALHQGGSAWPM